MSLNKVMIIGNVGKDPDVLSFQDGGKTAKFTVAASDRYTDRAGVRQERTEWFTVVVNGKTADVVESYVRRGSQVYVEGRIQTRKYQAQDGTDRYVTEVICLSLQLLGARDGQSHQPQPQPQPQPRPQYQPQPRPQYQPTTPAAMPAAPQQHRQDDLPYD